MHNISRRSFVSILGSVLTILTGSKAFGASKPLPPKKRKVVKKSKPILKKTTETLVPVQVNSKSVSLRDIPVGGSLSATYIDPRNHIEQSIVLHRTNTAAVVAFSAICTHRGCAVAFSTPTSFDCPCHGSSYNSQTGSVINGPAVRALAPLTVNIQTGDLFIKK